MNSKKNQSGFILVLVLVIASLLIILAGGLSALGIYRSRLYDQLVAKQEALHVAEAGINYYRWHLAHSPTDYMDGTGSDPGGGGEPYGPYIHNFVAPSSGITGTYSLEITPPPISSTVVLIKSTGWLDAYPNVKRNIEVRYGIPSLAHYSFLTHSDAWFDDAQSVAGKLHSNGAVRMDGTNDSIVSSARQTFVCTEDLGCADESDCLSPCVWRVVSGPDYCECPGVFGAGSNQAYWQFPVPTIDFSSITMDLNTLRASASTTCGLFKVTGSNYGFHITFNSNGTFDARQVTGVAAGVSQKNSDWTDWSWPKGYETVAEQYSTQAVAQNCAIPSNGIIFIEDGDAWVDGTVNGRVTLAAATLPDNVNKRRTIFINNNLTYLARDGNHVLGLIAQKDVKVPLYAPTDLVIDAVMLAQNGRVFRNRYRNPVIKNSIEVYGSIITKLQWKWTWFDESDIMTDGYQNAVLIYDPNVTNAPPPDFPTTGEYAFISWEEK